MFFFHFFQETAGGNQEMLFKPFYTTRAEGTGLGLVIVQKMLAEMDCSIQVKSTEFEETTFSILLPVGLTEQTEDCQLQK